MAKIPRHRIAAVLAERSLGRFDSKAFSEQLAAYLLQEHRVGELEPLLRDIMQYRAERGIVEVVAISAFPLSPAVVADVERETKRQFPEATQIIVSAEHDPDAVGGVRLEFPNQQLDLSVRGKLSRFKQLTLSPQAGQNERN